MGCLVLSVSLAELASVGVVSSVDVHAARAWGRIGSEAREDVLVAAALASRAVSAGHVCLDLTRVDDLIEEAEQQQALASASEIAAWPSADEWREVLLGSPLVHAEAEARSAPSDEMRPLVIDRGGRLYLRRYWEHQERLADRLRARIDRSLDPDLDVALLEDGLARLFRDADPDEQRRAAEGALRSSFYVISGGPGTGKTFTVVKILALMIEQSLARHDSPPRILLLAPTGKAAAHLQASVSRAAADLDCAPDVRAAIPGEASTVHRALGAGGRPVHYRHDARHPLPVDLVLVDEASMVDLALMARLLEALPDRARLILLGDRDQLASVEAGAVLGDIAAPPVSGEPATSRPVAQLEVSHRFAAESSLGALVRAIHAGDADTACRLLDDPASPTLRRIDPDDGTALRRELVEGYEAFASAVSPEGRLAALDRYRVLCAHRHGRVGVAEHNRLVEGLLVERDVIDVQSEWYLGRPILIRRNDYAAGLYNGDVGLVAARDDGTRAVLFRTPEGRSRWLSPRRVDGAETVFAMSVHKSQGSELDAVLVVLPDEPSPIVTRELLYTAVSRARTGVCIRASHARIREALARRVVRTSGLREAIWGGTQARRPDDASMKP